MVANTANVMPANIITQLREPEPKDRPLKGKRAQPDRPTRQPRFDHRASALVPVRKPLSLVRLRLMPAQMRWLHLRRRERLEAPYDDARTHPNQLSSQHRQESFPAAS